MLSPQIDLGDPSPELALNGQLKDLTTVPPLLSIRHRDNFFPFLSKFYLVADTKCSLSPPSFWSFLLTLSGGFFWFFQVFSVLMSTTEPKTTPPPFLLRRSQGTVLLYLGLFPQFGQSARSFFFALRDYLAPFFVNCFTGRDLFFLWTPPPYFPCSLIGMAIVKL